MVSRLNHMLSSRVLLGIALMAIAVGISKDAAGQSVRVWAPYDSISVGERFQLLMALDHDGSRQSVFPDQVQNDGLPGDLIGVLGDVELIRRIGQGSRLLTGGGRRDSVLFEATTFALDSAYAEPVGRFATEQDTIAVLAAVPIVIPVRSVVPADAEDVRDLAPLAEFPRTWWPWLLLAALIVLGAWWYRRYQQSRPPPEPQASEPMEPAESAVDEALRRLSELESGAMTSEEDLKPFFVEVSDIARTYVARRMRIPAREQTTFETLRDIAQMAEREAPSEVTVSRFRRLLQEADLVKFADFRPEPVVASEAVQLTRNAVTTAEADFRARRVSSVASESDSPTEQSPEEQSPADAPSANESSREESSEPGSSWQGPFQNEPLLKESTQTEDPR